MEKIFYFSLLLLFSCKVQDCPTKHPDLSEREYNKYCKELKESSEKKDYYFKGVSLCNLKQPAQKVYKLLNKSIKQHDTLCYQIHQYQDYYKTNGFQVNILRIDTIRWKKLCVECEKIVPLENYYEKKIQAELAYKKQKALKESKLDITLFNKELITLLSVIIEKDQRIRGLANLKEKKLREKEQMLLDSLNLVQIDSIFRVENGYPSIQKVGYDQVMTPWYVLQHQLSIETRKKYLPILEEAVIKGNVSKSLLENYKNRTITYEEEEIRKKQKTTN